MKHLMKKSIYPLLMAVMLLFTPFSSFGGGSGIAELSIIIEDSQEPTQFNLTPQDLTGDLIFTNIQGDTIEVAPTRFKVQGSTLWAFFSLVAENPEERNVLIKSPGEYIITQYPTLPEGYSFVPTDEIQSFWLYNLEPYAGTFDFTLLISSMADSETAPFTNTTFAIRTANPTTSTVIVDGEIVAFEAYNIMGNNYFKLRDIAYILSGTAKQFEVDWDNAANTISLTSGLPYTVVGGEMNGKGSDAKTPTPANSRIIIDGATVFILAYNIEDNNYFKLRDIGSLFDFGVDWDEANNTIIIDTSKGYSWE